MSSNNWRDDLRVVPLSRRSRPYPSSALIYKTDSRLAQPSQTAHSRLNLETIRRSSLQTGAAAPIKQLEGRPPCCPTLAAKPPLSKFRTHMQNRFPTRTILTDGAFAPEAWDDTEVIPPNRRGSAHQTTGGTTSVSSHSRGIAAPIQVSHSSTKPIPNSHDPHRRRIRA